MAIACAPGTPYGDASRDSPGAPPEKSEEATTGAELDASPTRPHPPHRPSASGDASAAYVPEAGAFDGATSVAAALPPTSTAPPTSTIPNCGPPNSAGCEDCCFDNIPGANALNNAIDNDYYDCVNYEGCFGDPNCEDYCDNAATNDICSGQPSICNQIDACIGTNRCDG
jgi:hypothetical protein